jgi:hypothetical protein
MMVPGAPFCHACGFAMMPQPVPVVSVVPPAGTQKAMIGPSPMSEIIGGFFAIVIGIIAGTSNPFFAPIAVIAIIIGIVMLALGAMGISIPSQQVVFQTAPPPGQAASGPSTTVYQETPKSFLKQCPVCGQEIPIAALACYKCGTVQE